MLRIPWTARRTNVSVLRELTIGSMQRVLRYFGQVTRRDADNLDRLMVTGKM